MPTSYQELRVLLVSPSDVASERGIASDVVEEINRGIAPDRGYRLALWRWETDTRPGLHVLGPQGLIDDLMSVSTADVVIGVFWKRFGTPVSDAGSGTEHELRRAWTSWRSTGAPEVMVYFGTRGYVAKTPDESEQAARVDAFKRALPEEQMWWAYRTRRDFERLLREHLTRYVLRLPAIRAVSRSDEFSPSIRKRFAELDIVVERLTARQSEVIEELTDERRVLISGAAGSGKTLVAAEKAIRTAMAGYSTLFLCHNPLLADWVRELTRGSRVSVLAFEDLVADRTGEPPAYDQHGWTIYGGPSQASLERAASAVRARQQVFSTVIVDEGQDFRPEWWGLIETCVADAGSMYIFFDAQQALIPYRSELPAAPRTIDLSRNIRNAGPVYEVMSRLARLSAPPDQDLSQHGAAALLYSGPGKLRDSVARAVGWLNEVGGLENCAAVLGGSVSLTQSVLAEPISYGPYWDWRSGVRDEFFLMMQIAASSVQRLGSRANEITDALASLTDGPQPTQADRDAVTKAASALASVLPGDAARPTRVAPTWRLLGGESGDSGLRLYPRGPGTFPFLALEALRTGAWIDALPAPDRATFMSFRVAEPDAIPVFAAGDIKGLERDAVLVVMQGEPPEPTNELFVGVSRARSYVAVALDEHAYRNLPPRLRDRTLSATSELL